MLNDPATGDIEDDDVEECSRCGCDLGQFNWDGLCESCVTEEEEGDQGDDE